MGCSIKGEGIELLSLYTYPEAEKLESAGKPIELYFVKAKSALARSSD